jgi:hypothetical protein
MSFTDKNGRQWEFDGTHQVWVEVTVTPKLRKLLEKSVKL